MKKRLLACLVSLVLCAGLWVPAAAADNSIKQVEAGYLFSMILTNGGDLYGCGLNSPESLPLGPDVEMLDDSVSGGDIVPRPQKITDGVVKIASSKAPSPPEQWLLCQRRPHPHPQGVRPALRPGR